MGLFTNGLLAMLSPAVGAVLVVAASRGAVAMHVGTPDQLVGVRAASVFRTHEERLRAFAAG